MDERQILGRAISFYGSEIQRVIAIEELSELQKELCKSLRTGADRPHIAEEIADVQIMADGDKTFIRFIPKNKQPRCYFNMHLECPADRVCAICRNDVFYVQSVE